MQLNWSGLLWNVRSGSGGPGPNNWSDSKDNVFVDADNNLHLRITKNPRDSKWYCAELSTVIKPGYGEYKFNVVSNPAELADNVVGGLFYYLDDQNEIDIEFSRWANAGTPNTQYTVWTPGGGIESPRGEINTGNTTHRFVWDASKIAFESAGILSWVYNGPYIPKTGGNLVLNLWNYGGKGAPSNGQTQELVLSGVSISTTPVPPPPPPQPLSSIQVSPRHIRLKQGSSLQLKTTCKYRSNKPMNCPPLDWASLHPDTVSVDQNGVVTAKSSGISIITAKSGKITGMCVVTVR